MLALAAVAAGALMAFIGAGTASASKLCSTTVDPCPAGQHWPIGTPIDFSLKKETSANLTNTAGEAIDSCTGSTVTMTTTNTGSGTETVTAHITKLEWIGCTFPTTTVRKGCVEIHKIASTSNGTLTADKCKKAEGIEEGITEVTINTVFFGTCVYGIEAGKSIGDLSEGNPAHFTAKAVAKKLSGSNIACPETSNWSATYVQTEPSNTTLSVTAG
jgi:hypothetical protein